MKRILVAPSRDAIADVTARDDLAGHQVGLGVIDVEVIKDQASAGLQRTAGVADHGGVVAVIFEVAEAREEAEDAVELAATEGRAHVLLDESNSATRLTTGAREAAGG